MSIDLIKHRDNIFYRVVEDAGEAIMITDVKGMLIYVNPEWSKVYGYSREEAIGSTPRLLHSGLQSHEFYEQMWTDIRNPKIGFWKGEVQNRSKKGVIVPVLLTITPYRGDAGAIEGYMGIAMDLTKKKELQAQIVHQDRLASVGMLASGLAHEIGTPLGVIRGRAEFLGMQSTQDSVKKGLEVIVSQIDRISKLIQSLLRVSRGTGDIRLEAVSVGKVFAEVKNLLQKDFSLSKTDFILENPTDIRVIADFHRLEQVFLNLSMNALHAIKLARDQGRDEHRVKIEVQALNSRVSLKVSDTGCGIPAENLKKLFQPFFTTKQIGEGTGLGLSIVAQIVHEMNGEIMVESKVGVGTTFSIILSRA